MNATYADEGWKTHSWHRTHFFAQINSAKDMEWYWNILWNLKSKNPFIQEFKSDNARYFINKSSRDIQNQIWETLKEVLITIIEPKKYIISYGVDFGENESFIFDLRGRQVSIRKDDSISYEFIDNYLKDIVTREVIYDSPLDKVNFHLSNLPILRPEDDIISPERILSTLDNKTINKKVIGAIKVAARFTGAFFEVIDPDTNRKVLSQLSGQMYNDIFPMFPAQLLRETISTNRYFDDGDAASTKIINKCVSVIEDKLSYIFNKETIPHPIIEDLASKSSPNIQAADWAQGIAREIYESKGIAGLKDRFKYVIFNGNVLID